MSARGLHAALLLQLLLLPAAPPARAENVSAVVYPLPSRTLRFSHHGHRERAGCLECHTGVGKAVAVGGRHLPKEAVCRRCHKQTRKKDDSPRPGNDPRCATCHVGYKGGKNSPARSSHRPAHLRFSHKLHLARASGGCQSCHKFGKSGRGLASMSTCLGCHRRKKAPVRCVVCHPSRKDGRLVVSFPEGKLLPSGILRGDVHGPPFYRKHAAQARANKRYCDSCHQPRTCFKCHGATLRPMSIHSGDYVRRHSLDARRNQPRCSSCHRSQSFCLSCHQRLGVGTETPNNGFAPNTAKRFHPEKFNAPTRGPGHHAYSARRNIRTCSSCHREQTCTRCHGSISKGRGGISPHPPGWRTSLKCRAMSSGNHRACLKCHAPGDRRASCL